ncbi:MFS transporter [Bacteroidia bacterium]|nr:MFS transporter [Bacteroidia bacterium]
MTAASTYPRLFTLNYVLICCANFLLHFSFYLILPILPFYLLETFDASKALIGGVLACYTVTALLVRPFSGFFLDLVARKPLYLFSYFFVIGVYFGYMFAASIAMVVVVRLAHGLFFGMVTTAGSTLVIDIMPSERRGEGLGYFGTMSNLAMAIGPMVGMFVHNTYAYSAIFSISIITCAIGWVVAWRVKAPPKPQSVKMPLLLDRFILLKGLRGGASLLLMGIPYAITTSFVAMYAQQLSIKGSAGLFFVFFSVGLIIARLFSGKRIDRGQLTQMIALGTAFAIASFAALGCLVWLPGHFVQLLGAAYYLTAALIGISYGAIFPAYNTLFVNLGAHNQRGTASSTYMTSWDIGIGIGLLMGGYLSHHIGFSATYLLGAASCLLSWWLFVRYVAPHYHQNKLRG